MSQLPDEERIAVLETLVQQVANLNADGDIVDGAELVVDRADAWSTVNVLILEARELLGLEGAAVTEKPDEQRIQRIAELAEEQRAKDGEIEFDTITAADISEGDDDGAYVRGWIWVDFAGTDLEKDEEDDPDDSLEAAR